jgi:cytoskeletal protein RodZ
MFTKRTTVALVAIALASSLIVASGFVGFAFAAKKGIDKTTDTATKSDDSGDSNNNDNPTSSNSQTPSNNNPVTPNDNSNTSPSEKQLKSFFSCISGDAIDRNLKLGKIKNCYGQAFESGQGQSTEDQPSSTQDSILPSIR